MQTPFCDFEYSAYEVGGSLSAKMGRTKVRYKQCILAQHLIKQKADLYTICMGQIKKTMVQNDIRSIG